MIEIILLVCGIVLMLAGAVWYIVAMWLDHRSMERYIENQIEHDHKNDQVKEVGDYIADYCRSFYFSPTGAYGCVIVGGLLLALRFTLFR